VPARLHRPEDDLSKARRQDFFMARTRILNRWLDIRPGEGRSLILSLLGAFLILAFMILGRSLREALYLTSFPVETLPYVVASVAVLGLPAVAIFTNLLGRHDPRRVVAAIAAIVAGGLGLLWPFATHHSVAVVAFYLWTAVGTLLLTSGFWLVVADAFPVRGAKRLFGLISAGGTTGVVLMGLSLSWMTHHVAVVWLIPLLIVLLILFLLVQAAMPGAPGGTGALAAPGRGAGSPVGEIAGQVMTGIDGGGAAAPDRAGPRLGVTAAARNIRLIWRTPHLRTIAAIIFIATTATTLIDYQFKELARANYSTQADLAGFFGAFYGWTGGVALAVQLLVTGRIMASAGIAVGLAVLPILVLMGSAGILLAPGLLLVTLLRGVDNSLRKSLFRPLVELLYVPLPSLLRRRTKTFIDSAVDSGAEGFGALLVFVWVTLAQYSSRYLAVGVILLAVLSILLSRRMGREYFDTIVQRLKEEAGEERSDDLSSPHARDLLSGTFTRLNILPLLQEPEGDDPLADAIEVDFAGAGAAAAGTVAPAATSGRAPDVADRLKSPDDRVVLETLAEHRDWRSGHVPLLARLLARDALYERAIEILQGLGETALPHLCEILASADADFVIRRRVPAVLAGCGGPAAADVLLDALTADRFEVRYRAALALARRRRRGLPESQRDWRSRIWHAVRLEVKRDRPLWELQKLLDGFGAPDDDLVAKRVGVRGELSLEHTFRMLTLVLEPQPVRAAFQGIVLGDEKLKSFALEYLERVLPPIVRRRLWLFIGDVSEYKRQKEMRSLGEVVSDLISTRATLFAGDNTRDALRRMLEESDS
jgi:ATP/ADP translocase